MSAFIHTDITYSRILRTVEEGSFTDSPMTPLEFVLLIRAENYRSVNYRYDEETPVPEFNPDPDITAFTAVELVKILRSVRYQSCECRDYEATEAYKALMIVMAHAASGVVARLPEYDKAPWG